MKLVIISVVSFLCIGGLMKSSKAYGEKVADVAKTFSQPPTEFTTIPFWVWNDYMTEDAITRALEDFADKGIAQVFVHPRPGLMTPYLSDEWFRLWKFALMEAKRLGMKLWIYDENSYPSGFAGGHVPDQMTESRGLGIEITETNEVPILSESILAVYLKNDKPDGLPLNITQRIRNGETFPSANYLVAKLTQAGASPWFGGKWYVDLLREGVTQKFLQITLDGYSKYFGEEFGKTIPGVFTDEPHLAPAGGLHWTPDLPEYFEKAWGYSLWDHLPCLITDVGDWKRVRHNYYQTLLNLFVERWAKPYFDYCSAKGLEFTGHYWEHEWPNAIIAPDNMAMYAWQHRPGIDILFNQPFANVPHAQVGNLRSVLEVSSVAEQLGKTRTLCEAFGGGGWDMRLEDMKRIGEWLFVFGVNTLNEHLSWTTTRGARKTDYPPTFSYHSPWWDAYTSLEKYFTRLSFALTRGKRQVDVLVLEPTTTAWMYQITQREKLEDLGGAFHNLLGNLCSSLIEFHLASEYILEHFGKVSDSSFVIGNQAYKVIVLPPQMENINTKTLELLLQFADQGGKVLCCESFSIKRVSGVVSDEPQKLVKARGFEIASGEKVVDTIRSNLVNPVEVIREGGTSNLLFRYTRLLEDGTLLFLANVDPEHPARGTIQWSAGGVQLWSAQTGSVSDYPFEHNENHLNTTFEIPPASSLLLCFTDRAINPPPVSKERQQTPLKTISELRITPTHPNVLTLDFVDLELKGETKKGIYYWPASQEVFKAHGLYGNPWDHAIQFSDEYIKLEFPEDSGFKATYRFRIEQSVPKSLMVAIESTDIYDIYCNGKFVEHEPHEWFIDRECGIIDIRSMARVGENEITLRAKPFMIWHEIQPIFILGDFILQKSENGFVITPPQPLQLGPWNEQGYPFYGQGVAYTQKVEWTPQGNAGVFVELPQNWAGTVAEVFVNEKRAGEIYCQPYRCEITPLLKSGENTISVVVIGSLKNTLGPHHNNPPLGIAGPEMFRSAPEAGPPPAEMYHTIAYGLSESYRIYQEEKK